MQKELSKKRYLDILVMLPMIMCFDGESFDGNDFVDFIVLIITKFDHSRSCTAFDTASSTLGI
jgi:hypothetical protein